MNRITRAMLASIAIIVVTPFAVGAEKLSAERMWSMARLGDADISPDGKLAVVSVTRFDVAENRSSTDLWLYPTDGTTGRQLTTDAASSRSPPWPIATPGATARSSPSRSSRSSRSPSASGS